MTSDLIKEDKLINSSGVQRPREDGKTPITDKDLNTVSKTFGKVDGFQ